MLLDLDELKYKQGKKEGLLGFLNSVIKDAV